MMPKRAWDSVTEFGLNEDQVIIEADEVYCACVCRFDSENVTIPQLSLVLKRT